VIFSKYVALRIYYGMAVFLFVYAYERSK